VIDGERYVKASENTKRIGIGVTTFNRKKLCEATVAKLLEYSPNAKIVVVDDCSQLDIEINGVEVYKFKENVGIARAKNKCLELLHDCDDIFLFDDDTYPIAPDWYVPYVQSGEPHLMYLFDTWGDGSDIDGDKILYEDGKIVAHSNARGCMIYVNRTVLETVGGMDVRYGRAMNEHGDWTNRIYNAGLTSFKHMDVAGSSELIHSMDEHIEVTSTIPKIERRVLLHGNTELYEKSFNSTEYMPYGKDVVIACYFTGKPDAQRNNTRWAADSDAIAKLRGSLARRGVEFVLIHDCFEGEPNATTIQHSPYFERWYKEWAYLRDHPEINNVFVVDATDVDMLNNPFAHIEPGKLYIGDEPSETLANEWMDRMHKEPMVNEYLKLYPDLPLLNCGVVGGTRQMVMDVCRDMYLYGFEHPTEQTEMGIFNYLMHSKYADNIEYGRRVTTLFKAYEPSSFAWFRHK
jgi:glycosyltransferase involved in cell wall biosynthesis